MQFIERDEFKTKAWQEYLVEDDDMIASFPVYEYRQRKHDVVWIYNNICSSKDYSYTPMHWRLSGEKMSEKKLY